MKYLRGSVYDADLEPVRVSEQGGVRRPVIIVSRNTINRVSPVVTILPFTDARNISRTYPTDVLVKAPEGGLSADSVAMATQIRTIAKARLSNHRGELSSTSVATIDDAIRLALDL